MEFIESENDNRFGNAWTASEPLAVVVKVDGKEKRFEFFPQGKPRDVRLFQLRKEDRNRFKVRMTIPIVKGLTFKTPHLFFVSSNGNS